MKSSNESKPIELGRVIAQGMNDIKVEKEKNMAKAEKRHQTMLSKAAEKALSGGSAM